MTHTINEILKSDAVAILDSVCNGKVRFNITYQGTVYHLELDSTDEDWKGTTMLPLYKARELMRWIRKGVEDGTFIQLSEQIKKL